MSEPTLLPPEAETQLTALGSADLVVAVAAVEGPDDPEPVLGAVRAGLLQHFPGLRSLVLHVHAGGNPAAPVAAGEAVPVIDLPLAPGTEPGARAGAFRVVFEVGQRLQAKAFAVAGSDAASLTPGWVGRLLGPVANQDADLVSPYYQRHPYSGVVTSGILYPLLRALYGRRIRFPLGVEIACSSRLVQRQLASDGISNRGGRYGLEIRLLAGAVAGGFKICQAVLGPRTMVAGDGAASPSAVLAGVLSPVFAEMERTQALWQKIRGSTPVELEGTDRSSSIEPVPIDGKRLLEAYRLGQQNLQDVWGLVLPPGTLVDLKRLARQPDSEFRMADRVWARILYDFSLAYHTRIMSRDHLMGALAPLYLGWFGSLHSEMAESDSFRLEERLEQLCLQFEMEKPYLISRWRWPGRFIP